MAQDPRADRRGRGLLRRVFVTEPGEAPAVLWAALSFFLILGSYYMLRPVREAMGIAGGTGKLKWLFAVTMAAMLVLVPLYSALVARLPRRRFIPLVYHGFALALAGFGALFGALSETGLVWLARVFFVFVSILPTFVISVFWELNADLFRREQGERLFGMIFFAGSLGAIAGPLLTQLLVSALGERGLCLLAAGLLELAILTILALLRATRTWRDAAADPTTDDARERPIGGSPFAGFTLVLRSRRLLGLSVYIALMSLTETFLYYEQAHIVEVSIADGDARTELFATLDLVVNIIALLTQLFVVGRVITRLGLGVGLAALPLVYLAGFSALGLAPVLTVLIVFRVLQRATRFAMSKPAREILFTSVPREAKYKAKNFIDTVLYRGSDAISGFLYDGLARVGLGLGGLALLMVPVSAAWIGLALRLGRRTRAPG